MSEHDDAQHSVPPSGGLWRSRAGWILVAFAVISGVLLAFEHRAHLVTGTGLLLALLVLCVGMLFFLHGGHGRGEH